LPFVGELKWMAPSHTGNASSLLDHNKTKSREVAAAGMVIAVVVVAFLVRRRTDSAAAVYPNVYPTGSEKKNGLAHF
jgi:hypothetical protein